MIVIPNTACYMSSHVWSWAGSTATLAPIDPNQRCHCGRYTWQEAKEQAAGSTPAADCP